MKLLATTLRWLAAATLALHLFASARLCSAQQRSDEIVANLAGGRVIVHVTKDNIVFAAIDQPIEAKSVPPRLVELNSTHVGILLGASEWQVPADQKPIRLDRNLQRLTARSPAQQTEPGEGESDLEIIGVAYLEKLRPLVSQLHRKIDLDPDEPLFQVVVIGYAPQQYGPEVWLLDYYVEQEKVAFKGDYWQTRIQRPRFRQLYPPEKHQPRTLVEVRYPGDLQGPPLLNLIQANDPRIARLRGAQPRFAKVLEAIEKGQAQKANAADAVDFLRAALPLIAKDARFIMATMEEQRGFDWIVPPDEPLEKVPEDKNRPADAPSLRRKPKP